MFLECKRGGHRTGRLIALGGDPKAVVAPGWYPYTTGLTSRRVLGEAALMPGKAHPSLEVVRAFINAINQHKLADIAGLMTKDHTFVDSRGLAHSGREHLLDGWRAYLDMFPDFEIQAEHLLERDGVVAVFGLACGTYNGKRGLVPENRLKMPAAWKAVVTSGKIQCWQVYTDWTEGAKVIEADEMAGWLS